MAAVPAVTESPKHATLIAACALCAAARHARRIEFMMVPAARDLAFCAEMRVSGLLAYFCSAPSADRVAQARGPGEN